MLIERAPTFPVIFLLSVIVLGLACAPRLPSDPFGRDAIELERQFQLDSGLAGSLERRYRGFAVGEPVLIAAGQVCSRTVPSIGANVASVDDFAPSGRAYVRSALKLNEFVRVIEVVEGLGAHAAGLREGDILRAVNGVQPRSGAQALGLLHLSGPNLLRVYSDGRERTVEVQSRAKCDYPLLLPADRRVNAFANGESIIVTSALMELLEDDDELAMAIAHETAHNVLLHSQLKETNAEIGRLLGTLLGTAIDVAVDYHAERAGIDTRGMAAAGLGAHIGAELGAKTGELAYSKRFESHADMIALYLVERAGFDMQAHVSLFRKLAAQSPEAARGGLTHPDMEKREADMSANADKIRQRRAAGVLATRIRRPMADSEPSPAVLRSDLSESALGIAERRGRLLGRATTCRVPNGSIGQFEATSQELLREATYGTEQMAKALSVFEDAITRGTAERDTDCHFTIVEFYKELSPL